MKRILSIFLSALLATQPALSAVIATVKAGATSQSITIHVNDATTGLPDEGKAYNSSGIALKYWVHGANAATSITPATQTVSGAYSSGGFVVLGLGDGTYRLDIPNAALSAAGMVDVGGVITGDFLIGGTILVSPPVDVVSVAGTAQTAKDIGAAVPAAAAGASGGLLISGTNSGTTTLGALTVTGATTFTGATTWTGALTASNASNNFRVNGAVPGAAGGLFIAGTNAATAITTGLTTTFTGNLTGSVGSVTGAVGSVTGAVGSVTGAVGSVTGAVGSIASGGISEASYATTTGSFIPLGWTRQGTAAAASGSTSVTLDASAPYGDNTIIGQTLEVKGSTNGNYWQSCGISAYVASTQVATVSCPSGYVTPTGTITYKVAGTAPAGSSGAVSANVTQWNGTAVATPATAGIPDINVKNIDNDAASASGTVTFPNATLASTTNITAGTITTATNLTTNNDKTGYTLSSAGINAFADQSTSGHTTGGTWGGVWSAAGAGTNPWDVTTSGHTTAGTFGALNVTNLDTNVGSRMATYTQPTGFLSVTFPSGTVASTTNITAGTIATVTNLTNAPTAGDFTATMKTSIGTAVAGSAVASVTGNVGGTVNGLTSTAQGNMRTALGLASANLDTQIATLYTAASGAALSFTVDAIKAKTDSLTFTVAGKADTNLLYQNGVQVCGAGTTGDKWRACP